MILGYLVSCSTKYFQCIGTWNTKRLWLIPDYTVCVCVCKVWPPGSPACPLWGGVVPYPVQRFEWSLDSVPLNLACYCYRPMVVLVPPLSSLFPPPRFSRVPCPLQFARLLSFSFAFSPSVSFSRPPPPQQRLIPHRPSGGILRRTPPVDANQIKNSRSWVPALRVLEVLPPYAAGGTWLGCGLGGVEETTLYTRVLVNVTKWMKKHPFCGACLSIDI